MASQPSTTRQPPRMPTPKEELELLEEDIPDVIAARRLHSQAKRQVKHNYEEDSSGAESDAAELKDEPPTALNMDEFEEANEVECKGTEQMEGLLTRADMAYYTDTENQSGRRPEAEPQMDAFNLREEEQTGTFDAAGNYTKKTGNELEEAEAERLDAWLKVDVATIQRAKEAQTQREHQARERHQQKQALVQTTSVGENLHTLILALEPAETPMEALQRLNARLARTPKPRRRRGALDQSKPLPDSLSERAAIGDITTVCELLEEQGVSDVYEREREVLMREYQKHTGAVFAVDPPRDAGLKRSATEALLDAVTGNEMWEFRWMGNPEVHGPYTAAEMTYWKETHFGDAVEVKTTNEEKFRHVSQIERF